MLTLKFKCADTWSILQFHRPDVLFYPPHCTILYFIISSLKITLCSTFNAGNTTVDLQRISSELKALAEFRHSTVANIYECIACMHSLTTVLLFWMLNDWVSDRSARFSACYILLFKMSTNRQAEEKWKKKPQWMYFIELNFYGSY